MKQEEGKEGGEGGERDDNAVLEHMCVGGAGRGQRSRRSRALGSLGGGRGQEGVTSLVVGSQNLSACGGRNDCPSYPPLSTRTRLPPPRQDRCFPYPFTLGSAVQLVWTRYKMAESSQRMTLSEGG